MLVGCWVLVSINGQKYSLGPFYLDRSLHSFSYLIHVNLPQICRGKVTTLHLHQGAFVDIGCVHDGQVFLCYEHLRYFFKPMFMQIIRSSLQMDRWTSFVREKLSCCGCLCVCIYRFMCVCKDNKCLGIRCLRPCVYELNNFLSQFRMSWYRIVMDSPVFIWLSVNIYWQYCSEQSLKLGKYPCGWPQIMCGNCYYCCSIIMLVKIRLVHFLVIACSPVLYDLLGGFL